MLQRIQSLYLVGVFFVSVALFFVTIANLLSPSHSFNFGIEGVYYLNNSIPVKVFATFQLVVVNAGIACLSIVILFRFKHRKQQILLTKLCLLLQVVMVAGIFYYFENSLASIRATENLNSNLGLEINYSLYALFPILSLVFSILAIRAISADEELVRSADRIR